MQKTKIALLFYEYEEKSRVVHDAVVEDVSEALKSAGHRVVHTPVSNNIERLIKHLREQAPDIVFNICEAFAEVYDAERHIISLLEMLHCRFTGSDSFAMTLTCDKAMTKKLLDFHGILTPQFAVVDKRNIEIAGKMRFPLFVKPLRRDSSQGIGQRSLVEDFDSLVKRINFVHAELKDSALVEEYIPGREFYAGIIGNDPREPLPLIELDFSQLTDGSRHIYDHQAKSDKRSRRYRELREVAATDLSGELRSRIEAAALAAIRAVPVKDYARVDLRVTPDGKIYIVEINANPYLKSGDTLDLAARQAGMKYEQLINRILELSLLRWGNALPLLTSASKNKPLRKAKTGQSGGV